MKNYFTLEQFSLLYDHYAFIDVPEYYADQLFIQHKVTVRFGNEFQHPDQPYVVIFCKVRKRDRTRFFSALAELNRNQSYNYRLGAGSRHRYEGTVLQTLSHCKEHSEKSSAHRRSTLPLLRQEIEML